jgi:hypothetical protein
MGNEKKRTLYEAVWECRFSSNPAGNGKPPSGLDSADDAPDSKKEVDASPEAASPGSAEKGTKFYYHSIFY